MTITNETLMWLAPVTGAAVMAITSTVTGYFDTHRPKQASPSGPGHDGTGLQGGVIEEPKMDQVLDEIAQRIRMESLER
jgi:hypothetical protein